MSEKAEKSTLKSFLKMLIWHVKCSQNSVLIFHSYFDLHGESSNLKSQNLYYTMKALCAVLSMH